MTETELAHRVKSLKELMDDVQSLAIQKGRVQAAREVAHFVTYHLLVLTSPIAHQFATEIVNYCRQIGKDVEEKV